MKKINYRITVNINDQVMKLGFRGKLPDDMKDRKIRIQAIFTQRQVDRRFPMEVRLEETELGTQIMADAEIELPYVFYTPPRHKVNLIFALWCGTEERILDDQPFPIQKEQFARPETGTRKRNLLKFALCTMALPVLLVKDYLEEGKNKEKAKHRANDTVYRVSGYNYSPRQRNTDYFAVKYDSYVARTKTLPGNKVLFLSERLPEEGGNLQLIKKQLEADPNIEVTEFIHTKTVDALKKKELRECARKCAEAKVIILEDFYPQLHRLSIRRETKVVQLWHACGAFKTFGLTRMGKQGGAPQSSMNHRNYDFVSVSSETIRGIYAEAFAIPTGKVKDLGVPRTDCLFDWEYKKQRREQLYEKYPMLRDSRVILFAPTFRGDGNKDAHYPEKAFDVNCFMDEMPENTVCIVKHHPFVHQRVKVEPRWQDRVLDLTGQDHINDLMLISDLLITDYSSSVFEAALLELPMLFYAFDQEEYMASRDFYFAYEEMVPGPVEKTFRAMTRKAARMIDGQWAMPEEAESGQKTREEQESGQKMNRFREAFLSALDGHSTERISAYIKKYLLFAFALLLPLMIPQTGNAKAVTSVGDTSSSNVWNNREGIVRLISGLKSPTEMSLRRMAELHIRRQLRCCAARPRILFEIRDFKKVTRKQNITMRTLTPALERKISATTPTEAPSSDLTLLQPATRLTTARLPQGYTFDGTYYYYLSQLASFGSHRNDLRLTRVRYEGDGTYSTSHMTLNQFGHGTNLDCVTRNGVTWLWTGSDANGSGGPTTTISCFRFQEGKTLRKHAAISYRIPIQGKKGRYGTNCYPAISPDGTRLAVRFTNNGGQQFQIYSLTEGTKIEPNHIIKTVRLKSTPGVFQGFDINGTTIYTIEGTARKSEMKELGKPSAYDPIRIRSYNYKTKRNTVQTIKGAATMSHREPEGIQVDENGKAKIMIASHYKEKYTCANVYGVK